ncbi:MAG: hypothetical protein CMJ58_17630 [Planctomycetaceae bacterium]|nr:hypothetical protein [Planctomycetaceae bacterium]
METNNITSEESKTAADRPVHMVRRGAVAASIWKRRTNSGSTYYEYTLSRSWKRKSGDRQGYSPSFFSRNVGELSEVIDEATRWIVIREQAEQAEDAPAASSSDTEAA